MNNNKTDFDVIIVGGGTNGLSAGCYLGLEGKRTLVLEALDKVGASGTPLRSGHDVDACSFPHSPGTGP